jgi:dimethylargininase
MVAGLTAHPELGRPDYSLALAQHAAYVAALEDCGLEVAIYPADEDYPDSCFIEDVAVCTGKFALVTRPGAPTRRGETAGIEAILGRHYGDIVVISAPGSLEGGDVMMVGDCFYIGLSSRTNAEGARQFIAALERRGYRGITVALPPTLHLKTGLSWLGKDGREGPLLVTEAFAREPLFSALPKILVDEDEAYAANSLRVNDAVLLPAGYPKTAAALRAAAKTGGFRVLEVDTSEFRKLDGGLSCLSLRF